MAKNEIPAELREYLAKLGKKGGKKGGLRDSRRNDGRAKKRVSTKSRKSKVG